MECIFALLSNFGRTAWPCAAVPAFVFAFRSITQRLAYALMRTLCPSIRFSLFWHCMLSQFYNVLHGSSCRFFRLQRLECLCCVCISLFAREMCMRCTKTWSLAMMQCTVGAVGCFRYCDLYHVAGTVFWLWHSSLVELLACMHSVHRERSHAPNIQDKISKNDSAFNVIRT